MRYAGSPGLTVDNAGTLSGVFDGNISIQGDPDPAAAEPRTQIVNRETGHIRTQGLNTFDCYQWRPDRHRCGRCNG